MRTTVTFADDVAAAIERLRRERTVGMSEAVNELIRRGLAAGEGRQPFRQQTHPLALRIDVSNIGEALEELDGPAAR
jgi:hypothetical protein